MNTHDILSRAGEIATALRCCDACGSLDCDACPLEELSTDCTTLNYIAAELIDALVANYIVIEAERDAAVRDIEFLLQTDTDSSEFCTVCANNDRDQCEHCAPKWRGLCPENAKIEKSTHCDVDVEGEKADET